MLIEQLAIREQNTDLKNFLIRESVIPGMEITEADDRPLPEFNK